MGLVMWDTLGFDRVLSIWVLQARSRFIGSMRMLCDLVRVLSCAKHKVSIPKRVLRMVLGITLLIGKP